MSREYPNYPVPAASALVYNRGRVLLIKRRFEPGAGKWSLPGGKIELGETAAETAAREVLEETNVHVAVEKLLDVVDVIFYDRGYRVHYHYLIVVYLAGYVSGTAQNSEETMEVRWVLLDEALRYNLTKTAREALLIFAKNK